ncbi:hypothetical protein CR513_44415, partial [Mucuna pruriens]
MLAVLAYFAILSFMSCPETQGTNAENAPGPRAGVSIMIRGVESSANTLWIEVMIPPSPLEIIRGGVEREPHAEIVTLDSIWSFFVTLLLQVAAATTPKQFFFFTPLFPFSNMNFSALHPVRITAPLPTASTNQVEIESGVLMHADQFIAEPPPTVEPARIIIFPSRLGKIPPDSYSSSMDAPSREE